MCATRSNYYFYRLCAVSLLALTGLLASPPAAAQTVTAQHHLFNNLFTDADGSGGVTCGDTINFVAQLGSEVSGTDLEDSVWSLDVPANASVVPGSVIPSNPNDTPVVDSGNSPGDRQIRVRMGRICRSSDCVQFGATVQFHLRIEDPNAATELVVQAELSGSNFPPTPSDALETQTPDDPTVIPYPACPGDLPPSGPPDLFLTKTDHGATATAGTTISYRLRFGNRGETTATGTVLEEVVPPHTTFAATSSSRGWGCSGTAAGSQCFFVLGSVAPGEVGETDFAVTVDPALPAGVTAVINTAVVSDDGVGGPDPTPADNTASDSTPLVGLAPELSLAKTLDPASTPTPGGTLVWNLTYANTGNQGATGVRLTETVPAHTTFRPQDSDPRWSCAGAGPGFLCALELGDVPAGGSGSVRFAVTLDATLPAGVEVLENCAQIGEAEACHAVQPEGFTPDLRVTKSDQGVSIEPGGTVAYRLTYRNAGTRDATGVVLTETVPQHTTFAAAGSTAGWSCAGSGQAGAKCTLAVGSLAAGGASGEATFAVTLDGTVPADLTEIVNTVSVSDDGTGGPDANPADNTATETTPLTGAMPDLTVGKTLDPTSTPTPGGALVWNLTYANTGNQGAAGVRLTETVSAHTAFRPEDSDPRWSCAGAGPGSLCVLELGDVPAGGSGSVRFAVTFDATLPASTQEIENCAQIGEAEACHAVEPEGFTPDLRVTKSDQGVSIEPGGTVAYRLTHSNHGTRDATGVLLTETVPQHTTFTAAGSTAGWSCAGGGQAGASCTLAVGSLAAGGASGEATFTVTLDATVPANLTEIVNTVSVSDDGTGGPDANPADNTASETTPLTGAMPDLTVDKTLDPTSTPTPGGALVWNLAYANTGNQGATGVRLTETVPAHTTFRPEDSDPRWSCAGAGPGSLCALELGDVPAGGSGSVRFAVTLDATLPAGVEVLENCAQIGMAESCHTVAVDAVPDLAIIKDDGGATARPGDRVTYTLTVANHGNQGATGVVVTDRLPPGTAYSAVGSTPDWSCTAEPPDPTRCSLALGSLPAGGRRTVTLALTAGEQTGGTVLTNTATVSDDGSGGADPNPEDNTATDTTPVEEPPPPPTEPRLEVDLTDEPFDLDGGGLGAGDGITYVVFVHNRGGVSAEGVVFVVEPDPHTGLLADSVTTAQGTVLEGQGADDARVAVELGSLPAGGSAEILFTVEIAQLLPPELAEIVVQGLATAANAPQEPSDDPDTPEDDDPTRTPLAREPEVVPEDIPTLSEVALSLFALLLSGGALTFLRRRSGPPAVGRGRSS